MDGTKAKNHVSKRSDYSYLFFVVVIHVVFLQLLLFFLVFWSVNKQKRPESVRSPCGDNDGSDRRGVRIYRAGTPPRKSHKQYRKHCAPCRALHFFY